MNLHSHKYSGLANAKTIAINHTKGSGLTVSTRKPSAHQHQHATGRHSATIRQGSGSRRSMGIVAGQSKRNYRPDLRKVRFTLTSFLFLSLSQRR
ncbi:hypothetical protein PIIN_00958 [Serendipita indica DSM 11827]|uniref:Ribosomal eL28/Mak16 domain-containing protein n=1 Tax=Serendipita indica (strain DSM 11827) TaxID=1109443 RepID=G4T791_SERID|nr:hypothetical protein PIIN_00958 [Serendipita indica DSM 11827]